VPQPDFGKEDMVRIAQISRPLRIWDLWLCEQENMNLRRLNTNK
jgi:hypothetical protein